MKEVGYNRQKVYEYAKTWAFSRNPKYYNFDSIGGDCTNFVSQCIYEGSSTMNYGKANGWYYINGDQKSPSWTGVQFLYSFLTQNKLVGPHGKEVEQNDIEIGDIAQISFDGNTFAHSVVIVKIDNKLDLNKIYIASHTYDSFEKKIGTYDLKKVRFIHINEVRKY